MAKSTPPVVEPSPESLEEFPDVVQVVDATVPGGFVANHNHRESPVSINVRLNSPGGADCMLTVRSGATEEEVKSVIDVFVAGAKYANEAYKFHFMPEYPQTVNAPTANQQSVSAPPTGQPEFPPTSAPTAPPVQGNAPGITSLSFQTEKLVSETKEGTRYWKVVGPPFMKYGVRVWDEVLSEAGFALDLMNDPVYSIPGYTAHYVEREPGKPQKVVKLVEN